MAIANDGKLDVRLKALRNRGMVHRKGRGEYISELPGFNLRMSEILSLPMYPGLKR